MNISLTILLALLFNLSTIAKNVIGKTIEYRKLSKLSGDYTSAINHYKKAIQLDDNNYYAHLFLVNLYHIQKRIS